MISPFIVNEKNLFLDRFPTGQVNRSLQAWDAADEYLINYLEENELINFESKILIVNDTFGALTANLSQYETYCVNDSYISQLGIQYNIEQNHLDSSRITYLTSLDELPNDISLVILKIPKSKAMLTEQLIRIKNRLNEKSTFIAADRAKDIHSATIKLFEKYLGTTTTSLAVKKARLVFSRLEKQDTFISPFPSIWPMPAPYTENKILSISNHANVSARDKLDIGARYFIENLPQVLPNTSVIDLGCGNGVLGLSILDQQPEAHIQFFDESFMAIASTKENVEVNFPEKLKQCQFHVNDSLSGVDGGSVDLVLCNPPFHQQTATTDHIAWQMFKDSHRVLKKGGELRIIGNRQLAYHIKLQRIFGNETLIASNEKFVTTSAIKR